MRAFLALVGLNATLTGFKSATPEEVANLLRRANSFHHLDCNGPQPTEKVNLDRCLQTAIGRDVITFIDKDGTPTSEEDFTIAMAWDEETQRATFYTTNGRVSYIVPSLSSPPTH
jgi:hypothetical protein